MIVALFFWFISRMQAILLGGLIGLQFEMHTGLGRNAFAFFLRWCVPFKRLNVVAERCCVQRSLVLNCVISSFRRQFRYCEDQIRYHYTHDRSVLTSLRVSNTNYALATAQISTVSGDVEANARLHREVMEVAAHAAIDILIFPELSLTGYFPLFWHHLVSHVIVRQLVSSLGKGMLDVVHDT